MSPKPRLIILLGPTAVGKTDLSLDFAEKYSSPVISCDSRQLYKEMSIGTAVPTEEQLARVRHYFIQDRSIHDGLYTAGRYEIEALELIHKLFEQGHDTLIMAGGSGFYIDAVCKGLDDLPQADMALREELTRRWKEEGIESISSQLRSIDPESCLSIDMANGQRVIRALEVCLMTGKPFSSFKTSPKKQRSFEIQKIGFTRPRDVLYERINRRVDAMFAQGLADEARGLYEHRKLAALQTVGYKELFDAFDGLYDLDKAKVLIQRNSRHYAKRQMTWWGRDKDIEWREL